MSMFNSNGLKRRAIYKYVCSECGNLRASFIYDRALNKVCMACQKNKPDANQPALFGVDVGDGDSVEIKTEYKMVNGEIVNQRTLDSQGNIIRDWLEEDQPIASTFYPEPNFTEDHLNALKIDNTIKNQELDKLKEQTMVDAAFKKTAEARAEHEQEKKDKQFNQVIDADVDGEITKRDQFFAKHGADITVQKEIPEEDALVFTYNGKPGMYVTGEYFRWKPVDFYANAEYFMDDLPLVYSAGLEVELVLAKE